MTHQETREALAAYAHEAWAGWMRYLFSKCEDRGDGRLIPPWAVERWTRQARTPYAELPEQEKESDRAEADKMLMIVVAHEPPNLATLEPTRCARCAQPIAFLQGEWVHFTGMPQPFHWPEPPPAPAPDTAQRIGELGEARAELGRLRAATARLESAWDALKAAIDTGNTTAWSEARDALDTAILAVIAAGKGREP